MSERVALWFVRNLLVTPRASLRHAFVWAVVALVINSAAVGAWDWTLILIGYGLFVVLVLL